MAKISVDIEANGSKAIREVDKVQKSLTTLKNNVIKAEGTYLGADGKDAEKQADAIDKLIRANDEFADGLAKTMAVNNKFNDGLDRNLTLLNKLFGELSYRLNGSGESLNLVEKELANVNSQIRKLESSNLSFSVGKATTQNKQEAIAEFQKSWDDAKNIDKSYAMSEFTRTIKENAKAKKELEKAEAARLKTLKEEEERTAALIKKEQEDALAKQNLAAFYSLAGDKVGLLRHRLGELEDAIKTEISLGSKNESRLKSLGYAYKKTSAEIQNITHHSQSLSTVMKGFLTGYIGIQLVVRSMRTALSTTINILKESSRVASEAEETLNLFKTTFEAVGDSAVITSQKISNSLGLATSTAQKALGSFGDLAIGYGQTDEAALKFAEDAAKTILDLVSYKNLTGDMNDIMQKFASGLAGNVENFRKMGIVITKAEVQMRLARKGMDGLTGAALQYAQIQERLAIVQEKSRKAMGDMEKTLESTENVNRRFAETNKEWMSNFGSGINKALTPLKRYFMEMVDGWNRATNARKAYESGQKDISIMNIDENSKDRKSFYREMNRNMFSPLSGMDGDVLSKKASDALEAVMTMYGASATNVSEWANAQREGKYTKEQDKFWTAIVNAAYGLEKTVENQIKAEKAESKRKSDIQSQWQNFSSMLDYISSINGVNLGIGKDKIDSIYSLSTSSVGSELMKGTISGEWKDAIKKGIESITVDSVENPIDKALGMSDKNKLYGEALDSLKQFYEALSNGIKTGQIAFEGSDKALEAVIERYGEILKQQKEYNDELDRQKKYQEALASIASETASYESRVNTYGMSEKDAAIYNAKVKYEGSADSAEFKKLIEAIEKWFNLDDERIRKENIAKITASNDDDFASALSSARDETQGVFDELKKLGMTDLEKSFYDIDQAMLKLKLSGKYTEEQLNVLGEEFDKTKEKMKELSEAESLKYIDDAEQGLENATMGSEISAAAQGFAQGGPYGAILAVATNIVSKLEVVEKLGSIISDTIVPVLNAFLKPMLPILKALSSIVQNILVSFLLPWFEKLKPIWIAIVSALGAIDVGIGMVKDTVRYCIGKIQNALLDAIDKIPLVNIPSSWYADIPDIMGNANAKMDEYAGAIAEIAKSTMEIADNTSTSKSDAIAELEELLAAGLISENTFNARSNKYLNGNPLDSVASNGTWNNGYSAGAISRNVTYYIEGTNLTVSQIKQIIVEAESEVYNNNPVRTQVTTFA